MNETDAERLAKLDYSHSNIEVVSRLARGCTHAELCGILLGWMKRADDAEARGKRLKAHLLRAGRMALDVQRLLKTSLMNSSYALGLLEASYDEYNRALIEEVNNERD